MLNCLVFSKDRPAQLDLLLRMVDKNFLLIENVEVLYKATNADFEHGYQAIGERPFSNFSVLMYKEISNFRSALLSITKLNLYIKHPFIVFLSDDCVITREVDKYSDHTWERELDYKTCGFSLKLGENVTWGYCHAKTIEQPKFLPSAHGLLRWRWTLGDLKNDWFYPNSLIATVRRTDWMFNLLNKLDYTSPNWLEGAMNSNRDFNKPEIVAHKVPKIMGIEINRVQDVCPNLCGNNPEHSAEALNKKFLEGYQIVAKNFYDIKSNSQQTHDVKIEWEKR